MRKKLVCPFCSQKLSPKMVCENKVEYHYYYCANYQCHERGVSANAIEKEVKKAVIQFLIQSSVLDRMLEEIKVQQCEELSQKKREKQQNKRRIARLLIEFEDGVVTPEQFSRSFSDLKKVNTVTSRLKTIIKRENIEALLEQQDQIRKQTLPEEFYFNLIDRINMDETYKISEIYLKNFTTNIIEQEEIKL